MVSVGLTQPCARRAATPVANEGWPYLLSLGKGNSAGVRDRYSL